MMSGFIAAVMFVLMGVAGAVAIGYMLYGGYMTLQSLASDVQLHIPRIHTGGLAPHH